MGIDFLIYFFLNELNAKGEDTYQGGAATLIQRGILDINYILIGL